VLPKARCCGCAQKGKRGKKSGTRNMFDTGTAIVPAKKNESHHFLAAPSSVVRGLSGKSRHSVIRE